jgi:DNA-binding CsgD family transcriptional regulator
MITPEVTRRAFEVIADIQEASSLAVLQDSMTAVVGELGYSYFAVGRFYDAARKPAVEMLCGHYQAAWAAHYREQNYAEVSPMSRALLQRRVPYSWSDFLEGCQDPLQIRISDEAREHGLGDGVYIPGRLADGGYAAAVFSGSSPLLHDPLARTITEVLGGYYFREAQRLLSRAPLDVRHLSPRQRDCLYWVREGKSSAAIGIILGISAHTVDDHIREACRKLRVQTRVQAALEATLRQVL